MNSDPARLSTSILDFYNFIGERYDWFGILESRAKISALRALQAVPGQWILNLGAGTGKEHRQLQEMIQPGGFSPAIDLSPVMAHLVLKRTGSPVCIADIRELPFASGLFDSLFCSYVLELLPMSDLVDVLVGLMALLKPGGRAVLLSMSEGTDLFSKAFVSAWKLMYRISPVACGGCLPLKLGSYVEKAGLKILHQQIISQFGLPSELILAEKP